MPARIAVTVVSHNEEDGNAECRSALFPDGDFERGNTRIDEDKYRENRALVVDLATMIVEEGAAWDMQSDFPFLDAVEAYDDGALRSLTDNRNLIDWLVHYSPEHIIVDAHSHERRFLGENLSIADVAAFIEELSGEPSTRVVGGFLAFPAEDEDWTRYRAGPLEAVRSRFDGYAWSPTVLWGGASVGHAMDEEISGVWRPKSPEEFAVDAPEESLVNIGSYTGDAAGAGLDDLLGRLERGELEAGHLYTVTLMLGQCMLDDEMIEELRSVIRDHQDDVAADRLVWATLPEVERIWREDYLSVPTIFTAE